MKTRWALRFVLFVAGFVTAVLLVLQTDWAGQQLCARGRGLLSAVLAEPVTLEHCALDPLGARLEVEGIRVGGDASRAPLLSAERLLVVFAPLQAFGGTIAVERLEVDGPELALQVRESPPGAQPAAPGEDGCLGALDRLRIRQLRVQRARADVALPGDGLVTIRGLSLDGRRSDDAYELALLVEGGGFDDRTLHVPLSRVDTRVRLDLEEERLEVSSLTATLAGVGVFAGGEVRHLCRPELALRVTARTELAPLLAALGAQLGDVKGRAEVTAAVGGTAEAPQIDAKIAVREAALLDLDPGDLDADVRIVPGRLELVQLEWPVEKGRARVTGWVSLTGELATSLTVRTEALEFQRLLAKLPVKNTPVIMTIDSEHRLTGKLLGGLELVGDSSIDIRDFRVRNVPWHVADGTTVVEVPGKAHIQTPIRLTTEAVDLEGARITFGGGTVIDAQARLNFDEQRGLHIRAHASHLDMEHLDSHIAGLPIAGAGVIDALIAGPYDHPDITGEVALSEARFFSAELGTLKAKVHARPDEETLAFEQVEGARGQSGYTAEVRLQLKGEPRIDGQLALREGSRLQDVFNATRQLVAPLAWLEGRLEGRVEQAKVRITGPVRRPTAMGELRATDTHLLGRRFDRLDLAMRFEDGSRLIFDRAVLGRGNGKASGSGEIRIPGLDGPRHGDGAPTLELQLDAEGLPIRELLGEFGEYADLKGGVGGHLRLKGPAERLELSGELFAGGLSSRGVPLSVARLSLETQGEEVIVRGPVCGAGTLAASVRLADGLPFDASFALAVSDVARYLPPGGRIGGEVRGTVDGRGQLADLASTAGSAVLEKVALTLGDYRVENQGDVSASYSGSAFVVYALTLRGENTELSLYGNRSQAGALDMQAHGTFDARLLDTLVPQIEHAAGVVELKASVTGSMQKPVLVGSADVRRGSFRAKVLPIAVQKLQGTLAFSQNQVVVEEATMLANQGKARVHGTVGLKDLAPATLDLVVDGERISWRLPEDWPAIVSGRLQLAGGWPSNLLLSGELAVERLRFSKDLDLERAVLDFRKRAQRPAVGDEEERLKLAIDLVGGPDMRVDNNLVKAKLQFVAPPGARDARLKVVGSNVRVGLLGEVEVVDAVALFRGNEYRITQGVVQFDERDRIDPKFDVQAETEVRDYRVGVHAFGRLGQGADGAGYQLQLVSEPALAQADIITLLTFGITSRDANAGAGAAAGAGVAAEALLAVSGLEDQMKRWLPDTKLVQDPDLSVTSQYSEATGQLEPMALFEAKVLSERLKLKAATPFSTPKGRRASAEYKVNEHLSGQVLWENEETGYSAGDLGVDLKLRWEWE